MQKFVSVALMAICLTVFSAGMAMAGASVSWFSPGNFSTYCVGTIVNPTGQASGSGQTGGTGLDLMFVIDRSGSMSGAGLTNAKAATNSLIDSLPKATTQAGLASFDQNGYLNQALISMGTPANVTTLKGAVNALTPGGTTGIGFGINVANTQLTGPNAIAGHTKMEVVLSDGYENAGSDPLGKAATAWANGITVHTVGVPGHDATLMQQIATAGHGTYTNVTNLSDLENIFNGTAGNLVGLDHLEITLPDGTQNLDFPTDGLGNFTLPNWSMALGNNIFSATAYATDGSSATATLTLIGTSCTAPIPGSLLLVGSALVGLIGVGRRRLS